MAIPTFDKCMRPLLEILSRNGALHMSEVTRLVADHFKLTPEDRQILLPSGRFTLISNRVGWARTFLGKAGLIEKESRGVWRLSDLGREALKQLPASITPNDLRRYPSFQSWADYCNSRSKERQTEQAEERDAAVEPSSQQTPDEAMVQLAEEDFRRTQEELLEQLRQLSPADFERVVEELIIKLGYGASADEVRAKLRHGAGDNGIDAVIKEDRLGLDLIYIQAKRYKEGASIGRPDIQAFVGAMDNAVRKGLFITTASFTAQAREYAAARGERRVGLIDGSELARLMIELRLGVRIRATYHQFEVDASFFSPDAI
jgi:restriction system protein